VTWLNELWLLKVVGARSTGRLSGETVQGGEWDLRGVLEPGRQQAGN